MPLRNVELDYMDSLWVLKRSYFTVDSHDETRGIPTYLNLDTSGIITEFNEASGYVRPPP